MTTLICSASGKIVEVKTTAKGNAKLPPGWKWRGDKCYSAEAWSQMYCLRAITVPVVSPVIEHHGPSEVEAAWKLLREQLAEAWQKSTECANWAVRRLWSNDVLRQPGAKKCPPPPKLYLYGERDWTGWSQSAGAVLRTIESSYRRKRYEIVWVGSAGVPNVRYPYPFPIHNASWNLDQQPGGAMVFGCRLPAGRVVVRLKTTDKGGRYRMQSLKHLLENPELRGEAAILRKSDGTIMVKMVGWFPKTVRDQSGELLVRTSAAHLLTLFNDREETQLIINGDWIRRKVAGHSAALERWHDDQKLENRIPKRRARMNAEDMQAACRKMHSRLKSFIDETCAKIVNYAIRRRLAVIRYDDKETGYFASFPWFRLRERLKAACEREGLRFEGVSAEPKPRTSRKKASSTETAQ